MIDNKYYVIDAHAHIYPDKIAAIAVHHTDDFYHENSYSKGTVEDLLTANETNRIDKFVVQSVATTPKQVKSINEFIANSVNANKDRFVGLGTVHPESTDAKGDMAHLIELGLKGIKIHPDIQNFDMDDKGYIKFYELCEEYSIPVLMHTGDNRYDHSNPNRLIPLLKNFPNLTIVGAHFGGWSIWEEACDKLNGINNFYVDCSSSFHYLSLKTAKKLILKYGTDRVLFGTDYPMWNAEDEINKLLAMNLKDKDYKNIFSENAKRVYKIND